MKSKDWQLRDDPMDKAITGAIKHIDERLDIDVSGRGDLPRCSRRNDLHKGGP